MRDTDSVVSIDVDQQHLRIGGRHLLECSGDMLSDRSVRHMLPSPPEELTRTRLLRLGEGIGKVVYASEHWVVKRERSPSAIIALIVIWKFLRRAERHLPARL